MANFGKKFFLGIFFFLIWKTWHSNYFGSTKSGGLEERDRAGPTSTRNLVVQIFLTKIHVRFTRGYLLLRFELKGLLNFLPSLLDYNLAKGTTRFTNIVLDSFD